MEYWYSIMSFLLLTASPEIPAPYCRHCRMWHRLSTFKHVFPLDPPPTPPTPPPPQKEQTSKIVLFYPSLLVNCLKQFPLDCTTYSYSIKDPSIKHSRRRDIFKIFLEIKSHQVCVSICQCQNGEWGRVMNCVRRRRVAFAYGKFLFALPLCLRPPLKIIMFPVHRPGDLISGEWAHFFHILEIFLFFLSITPIVSIQQEKIY